MRLSFIPRFESISSGGARKCAAQGHATDIALHAYAATREPALADGANVLPAGR